MKGLDTFSDQQHQGPHDCNLEHQTQHVFDGPERIAKLSNNKIGTRSFRGVDHIYDNLGLTVLSKVLS